MFEQNHFTTEVSDLIGQKNYPCVAALKSFHNKDYKIQNYSQMGEFSQRPALRKALLEYLEEYKKNKSPYFTFWAVFDNTPLGSEIEFEEKMWKELSSLTSESQRESDKDPKFSDDPADKNFCFALNGYAFFVVGLHPYSSRKSRRLSHPTLVFNVYEQFEQLKLEGKYEPMIEINRKRDVKFQGSSNPMVEKHGDDWESIQFSGKENPDSWKCPFHFHQQIKES